MTPTSPSNNPDRPNLKALADTVERVAEDLAHADEQVEVTEDAARDARRARDTTRTSLAKARAELDQALDAIAGKR